MSVPDEIQAAYDALGNLSAETTATGIAVGNYIANPTPRKKHHDALRTAGVDCVSAARNVITALEGLRRLGVEAERERGGSIHLVEESDEH